MRVLDQGHCLAVDKSVFNNVFLIVFGVSGSLLHRGIRLIRHTSLLV